MRLLLLIVACVVHLGSLGAAGYRYELSVCMVFQNEARWLKEWIEYNLLAGVEHFYLYNDHSRDGYREVLAPYVAEGVVELIDWTGPWHLKAQEEAFLDCLRFRGRDSKWVAFLDADEFLLTLDENETVLDVLREFEDYPALAVNWLIFGNGGVDELDPDVLMIEQLNRCSDGEHWYNEWVKVIVRPEMATGMMTVHNFQYVGGQFAVDPDGLPVPGWRNQRVPLDRIRINHYWGRSGDWSFGEKLLRVRKTIRDGQGNPEGYRRSWQYSREFLDEILGMGDGCEDTAIHRYVPALKERMKKG